MKKLYELMVLTVPSQASTESGSTSAKDVVEGLITKLSGTIVTCDEWGERFLAYDIKKHDRGLYFLYQIELNPAKVLSLDTKLRLEPTVLRHLLLTRQAPTETVAVKEVEKEVEKKVEKEVKKTVKKAVKKEVKN
jgi:small subunit ribosomal protein S6